MSANRKRQSAPLTTSRTPALDLIAQQLADPLRSRAPATAHEAECAALRQRVADLEAELNRRDVTDLVGQAVKAGHLLPSLSEWAISLGTKDTEALKGFIAGCARAMAGTDNEAREAMRALRESNDSKGN